MKKCVECGTLNKDEDRFCYKCGTRLPTEIREVMVPQRHEEYMPDAKDNNIVKMHDQVNEPCELRESNNDALAEEVSPDVEVNTSNDNGIFVKDVTLDAKVKDGAGLVPRHQVFKNRKCESIFSLYVIIGILLATIIMLIIFLVSQKRENANNSHSAQQASFQSNSISDVDTGAPTIQSGAGLTSEQSPIQNIPKLDDNRDYNDAVSWMGPFNSGVFEFVNGATVEIPNGFVDVTSKYRPDAGVEKYRYDFYNSSEQMFITLTEGKEDELKASYDSGTLWGVFGPVPIDYNGEILDIMYADEVSHYGAPVYEERNAESFLLTGYSGNDIYYTRTVRIDGIIYSLDFVYPTSNRSICDQLVLDTEVTFSGYHIIYGTALSGESSPAASGAPTLADLKAMVNSGSVKTVSSTNASLVLPTEKQMLANPFRAHVNNGKPSGSIYIMPMPEKGNGHTGTIKTGKEVWIVAQAGPFYFFCSDDGEIGWNGKGFFS